MVAVTLFVVSMSTLLFFMGGNDDINNHDLKTSVVEENSIKESIDVKSLQEDEKNYRKLVNNQEDPVFVMHIDGTISFASWDVETIMGYKPGELEHQVFFLLIHPEDLSTFLGAFGKVVQTKQAVPMVGPYRLRDQKGEYHLNVGSLIPVIEHGNIDSIAISTKDIGQKENKEKKDEHSSPENSEEKKVPVQPKSKKIMNQKETEHARFLADNKEESQD